MEWKRSLIAGCAVAALTCTAGVEADVIFSANYNTTLNAQVVPSNAGSSTTVVVDETNPAVPAGPVSLTTGGQGFGGGEALLAPDAFDAATYELGAANTDDWFPREGRFVGQFKVTKATPSTGFANIFEMFYEPNATLVGFGAQWRTNGSGATEVQIYGRDSTTPGNAGITTYNNTTEGQDTSGLADAMNVLGWHEIEVQWVTEAERTATENHLVDVTVLIDGEQYLFVDDARIGRPQFMDFISIGSGQLLGGGSFGQPNYEGLIDEVRVEDAIPEPGSLALLSLGTLAIVARRRKR